MDSENELTPADLLALVESAKTLSAEIDLSDLLEEILARAGKLTDSPSGSVILYDDEHKALYFAAATGPKAAGALAKFGESGPDRVPIEGSKAGQVFRKGDSLVVRSVEADPNHFKGVDQQTDHQTESMICVPLAIGKENIG